MSKDKLISKNNGSTSTDVNTMGNTSSNYNDGMGLSGMSWNHTQSIGTGIPSIPQDAFSVRMNNSSAGIEWSDRNMGMGSGGHIIGQTRGNNTNDDRMGNKVDQSRNSQSENNQQEMMHFARIIRLYYMVMYHVPLYSCLKLLYAHLNPNNPNKSALYNVIRDLCSKPRTLKQMSRVIIYNAVGQRPALTVNKLPLPTALREYVLSFEP
jgi:hypothetical protein